MSLLTYQISTLMLPKIDFMLGNSFPNVLYADSNSTLIFLHYGVLIYPIYLIDDFSLSLSERYKLVQSDAPAVNLVSR